MRIHVTRKLPSAALDKLYATGWNIFVGPPEAPGRQRLLWAVAGADAILSLPSERIDAEVMDRCPALKVISNCGASLANVDQESAAARGIRVCRTAEGETAWDELEESTRARVAEQAVDNLCAALRAGIS